MSAPRQKRLRTTCLTLALCAVLGATRHATSVWAADTTDACLRASLTNPEAGTGGMGGTGITGGMGGTGTTAATGGMGGTGTRAEVVPGTGGMGGTGIVGIVTGFASVCVNGVEVHYDARTPVSVNGQPAAPRDLAVGQVVAVQARMAGDRLQANGIGVIDAVAGPVTRINAATRELQVMGQAVHTKAAAGTDLASMRVGTFARVSGHRAQNGEVIASRIDTASGNGASVLGTVTRVETDAVIVNGTRVNMGGRGTRGITAGSEVFASGEWTGSALRADRVDTQPVRIAIARNERAILEGYVRNKTTRELNVGGVNIRIDDRVRYNGGNDRDAEVGRKVQVEMRRSGNEWRAERVILQRDDRQPRTGRDSLQQAGGNAGSRESGGSGRSDSGNSDSGRSGSGGRDSGGRDSAGRESGSSGGSGRGSSSGGSGSSRSGRN